MREIKFRAWLVNAQRMINVEEINFYNKTISYIEDDYVNVEQRWEVEDLDNVILMQSTGLKDKNGVEIYEGDVVQGYSIYPTAGRFEPFLMDEVYYTNRGTWDCYSYILGGFNEQVEVIGNIYENKELIEVECKLDE